MGGALMAGKPRKGKQPGKGTPKGANAPKLPERQDLGIGNLRPEHIAAIRRAPKAAPRGDGLSGRTSRANLPPRNAGRRSGRKG